MHRPRNPELYRAPHVLMRKGFGSYPVSAFVNVDVAFTDGLFALAGDARDSQSLRVVAGLLNSSIAHYWFFMTSSSWGVEREQIQLREYLSLPIPPVTTDAQKAIVRAVQLAGKRGATEDDWLPILDAATFKSYGCTTAEQDLILEALSIHLDEYQKGPDSVAFAPPLARDLTAYIRLVSSLLNSSDSIQWSVELRERSAGYVVVACRAGGIEDDRPRSSFTLDQLMALTDQRLGNWRSPAAVIQPSAIVIEGASAYLIKPDERRSWTRSAARSDVAEMLSAIVMAPIRGAS
jgi:hypothetical protein